MSITELEQLTGKKYKLSKTNEKTLPINLPHQIEAKLIKDASRGGKKRNRQRLRNALKSLKAKRASLNLRRI